jgi:2-methylcitrate dehydratase PrpD
MEENVKQEASQMIRFSTQVSYNTLPDKVINQVRRVVLDTLGCMIAGTRTVAGQQMSQLAQSARQTDGTTVMGVKERINPTMAANVNGVLANVLDGDDGHRMAKGHPAGVILPAAFAAAEMVKANGRQFMEALVAGYEVGLRCGLAINSGETYYGSGNWVTFGAAAAVGYLMGLNPKEMEQALGITEVQTPSCRLMGWIEDRRIPTVKEGMGWSAATGMNAAMMAKVGITGTLTIFRGKENFAKVNTCGDHYEMENVYFKQYPSCRWNHSALDLLFELMEKNKLDAKDIKSIHVDTFYYASLLDTMVPDCVEQAQYSIPFLLAVAALDGELTPTQMRAERFVDERVTALARKVTLSVDEEIQKKYPVSTLARLTIETRSGQSLVAQSDKLKGDWNYPMTDQEIKNKFRRFTYGILPLNTVEKLIQTVWELDTMEKPWELLKVI